MTIGQELLDVMLSEGARIPLYKQREVVSDLNRAAREQTLHHIIEKGIRIGFMSYFKIDKKVFVNNLIIFKRFRRKGSLLRVRRFIRNAFSDIDGIYWESKRRDRLCEVR